MSFLISKIVGALFAPATLLALVLFAALLWQTRRPRLVRGLLVVAFTFVVALSLAPVGHWLLWPLETRFPAPTSAQLAHVDGIIVLGGAVNAYESTLVGQPDLNDAAERMTSFVALARRYPDAKLVWSGGSGYAWGRSHGVSESVPAQALFESLGLPAARVIYERESRNTWENAVYSKAHAQPKPGETWLLVTSAWHMPRSVGIFRQVGWTVVPYPVDYLGADPGAWGKFEAARELANASLAANEWLGLASYHLLGRTSEWLPRADREGDAK